MQTRPLPIYYTHLLYCAQLKNNNARVVLHANDTKGIKYIELHTAHNDMYKYAI